MNSDASIRDTLAFKRFEEAAGVSQEDQRRMWTLWNKPHGFQMARGEFYAVDTAPILGGQLPIDSDPMYIQWPEAPQVGDEVWLADVGRTWGDCPIEIEGGKIDGVSQIDGVDQLGEPIRIGGGSLRVQVSGAAVHFVYFGELIGWRLLSDLPPIAIGEPLIRMGHDTIEDWNNDSMILDGEQMVVCNIFTGTPTLFEIQTNKWVPSQWINMGNVIEASYEELKDAGGERWCVGSAQGFVAGESLSAKVRAYNRFGWSPWVQSQNGTWPFV